MLTRDCRLASVDGGHPSRRSGSRTAPPVPGHPRSTAPRPSSISLAPASPIRRGPRNVSRNCATSRVLPTRSLVAAVRQVSAKPVVFIQGSAMGFYGASLDDRELDESFPPGDDFLGQLCVAWEAEAHPVVALGSRLVLMRSGVVLSPEDGILGRLRLPFLFFVGGPVSSGRQYMSWIHLDDWVAMATWALTTPVASGIFNATSPIAGDERGVFASLRARARPAKLASRSGGRASRRLWRDGGRHVDRKVSA